MSEWTQGQTRVVWMGGGLLVEHARIAVMLDAPVDISGSLADRIGMLQGIVLSSGRMSSVRGLLALLEAASNARGPDAPLTVVSPAADERVPAIVEVWTRGWPSRYPVNIDAIVPGDDVAIGPIAVQLVSVSHGEPDGQHPAGVHRAPGCAIRVTTPDASVVWVPGAAPDPAVRRACRGADLAVIEVGVLPWPKSDRPWRLGIAEALEASTDTATVWLVGDDGKRLAGANA